jgi:hypothetical protein
MVTDKITTELKTIYYNINAIRSLNSKQTKSATAAASLMSGPVVELRVADAAPNDAFEQQVALQSVRLVQEGEVTLRLLRRPPRPRRCVGRPRRELRWTSRTSRRSRGRRSRRRQLRWDQSGLSSRLRTLYLHVFIKNCCLRTCVNFFRV